MNQYFYEDQVYTVDKKGSVKFGLIVENEVNSCEISHFFRAFSRLYFYFNELSIFSALLSIKRFYFRNNKSCRVHSARYLAMGSMKTTRSRISFCGKES